MNSQGANLGALFGSAVNEGVLSQAAMQAIQIDDIGADIQAALGVNVEDVKSSEVVLVTQLIDDSGSIRFAGNEPVVRLGHNVVLDSLKSSKQKDGVLAMCRYLNGSVLYPYCLIDNATAMDGKNYQAMGGTPLYDESVTTLAAVLAKAQEFTDNGVACRTVTLIMTDGGDGSCKRTAADVKKIVDGMLAQETHIVAFMGVDDGRTDFRQIASEMGIPDNWVLTPDNSEAEIRKAFMVFSQSAQRASQSAASFSQASMGGFGP